MGVQERPMAARSRPDPIDIEIAYDDFSISGIGVN